MKEFNGKTTNDWSVGLPSSRKTERNHPLECDGTRPASKCSFLLKPGWLVVASHGTDSFGNFSIFFLWSWFADMKKIDRYLLVRASNNFCFSSYDSNLMKWNFLKDRKTFALYISRYLTKYKKNIRVCTELKSSNKLKEFLKYVLLSLWHFS